MVQELGNDHKEGWLISLIAVIDDSGGKVSFTATGYPHEYQPTFRCLGKIESQAIYLFQIFPLFWRQVNSPVIKVFEGHGFLQFEFGAPGVFHEGGGLFPNHIYLAHSGVGKAGAYPIFQFVNRYTAGNHGG